MAQEKKDENLTGNGQPQQGPITTSNSASSSPVSTGSRVASFSTGNQNQQGSGRFTNLKKYIDANKDAGSRLYSGIQNKVGSEFSKGEKEATTNAAAVRQGIQAGQEKLATTGQGLVNQVSATNPAGQSTFNAQAFVQDPNQLQTFTDFRTGKAIDEQALQQQQNQALVSSQNLANTAQNRANQAATEQGRFGLLKETFRSPTNNYTAGQQRLDNLFLQAGGGDNLGKLQQNLRTNLSKAQGIGRGVETSGTDLSNLTQDEQTLAGNLQDKINALEAEYVKNVEGTSEAVNKARQDEIARYKKEFGDLVAGNNLDQDVANTLGLTGNDRLLNTLLNNSDPNSYLNFNEQVLNGADQLATQDNRSYYDALGKLAGIDSNAYRIKGDTKVDPAVAAKIDEQTKKGVLRSRIDDETKNFNEFLNQTDYSTSGSDWGSGQFSNLPVSASLTDQQSLDFFDSLSQADQNALTEAIRQAQAQGGSRDNFGFVEGNLGAYGISNQGVDAIRNSINQQTINDPFGYYANQNSDQGTRFNNLVKAFKDFSSKGARRVKIGEDT